MVGNRLILGLVVVHHDGGGWIMVLVVAVMIVIGVAAWLATIRRRKELSAWAAANALSFDPSSDHEMGGRFPAFKVFNTGDRRRACNVMQGCWEGRGMLAFDYHYSTGSGKNRSHHSFSAVILVADVPLKPLLVRPENLLDKVTEFFGADDIDFESAEFSRKFFVKSPDRRWAYDVVHPRMMEFLLAGPAFRVEMDALHVMVCRGSLFSAKDFAASASLARGILQRLPEYLIRQQASAPL